MKNRIEIPVLESTSDNPVYLYLSKASGSLVIEQGDDLIVLDAPAAEKFLTALDLLLSNGEDDAPNSDDGNLFA